MNVIDNLIICKDYISVENLRTAAIRAIGLASWRVVLLTKYSFDFSIEVIDVNVRRLTNQLWKLIPMREHEENWPKQLDTVIIEIAGLNEIFIAVPQFLLLLCKLEGLKITETSFELYRKTVFEVINLL